MIERTLDFGTETKKIKYSDMYIEPVEKIVSLTIPFEEIDLELVKFIKGETSLDILLDSPNVLKITNITLVDFAINENKSGLKATLTIHGDIEIVNK